jgi:hypothetical protein
LRNSGLDPVPVPNSIRIRMRIRIRLRLQGRIWILLMNSFRFASLLSQRCRRGERRVYTIRKRRAKHISKEEGTGHKKVDSQGTRNNISGLAEFNSAFISLVLLISNLTNSLLADQITNLPPSDAHNSTTFFRKQCFSLKYSLVSPTQNFWRYV